MAEGYRRALLPPSARAACRVLSALQTGRSRTCVMSVFLLVRAAPIEWRGREPVFDQGQLFEQGAGQTGAKVGDGILDSWPDIPFCRVDQKLAPRRERDDPAPLIAGLRPGIEQAELDKLRQGARGARLADANGFRKLAERQRPMPVDRGEEGVWLACSGTSISSMIR